jgi:hypothetical protein
VLEAVLDTDIERTEFEMSENAGVAERIVGVNDNLEEIGAERGLARAAVVLLALWFWQDRLNGGCYCSPAGLECSLTGAGALHAARCAASRRTDCRSGCWLEESCSGQMLIVVLQD